MHPPILAVNNASKRIGGMCQPTGHQSVGIEMAQKEEAGHFTAEEWSDRHRRISCRTADA